MWTKEPETGAGPARKRKRTVSWSSTGSSEPSLSHLSQTLDAAATPPAQTSRRNSVYREGINQGMVSDEEDDNVSIKKDHCNEAFSLLIFVSLALKGDNQLILFTFRTKIITAASFVSTEIWAYYLGTTNNGLWNTRTT